MKPAPFEYQAPDSLDAALSILAENGGEAKLIAGGQSLVPAMNFRMVQPSLLVDIAGLKELDYVRRTEDGDLQIGALVRHRGIELNPLIAQESPLLHDAVPHIGHPQIRNRGTLGGALVHADPAAELPVIALALGARMQAKSVNGERWIHADSFFHGIFTTEIKPDEILVEVVFPPMPPRTGWSFMEVARRSGDYAMMGVAVLVTLEDDDTCRMARLVYLNAGDGPVDAVKAAQLLQGEKRSSEVIEAAAIAASETDIDPFGNVHASVDYQRHLAYVLTKRALAQAFDRVERREEDE